MKDWQHNNLGKSSKFEKVLQEVQKLIAEAYEKLNHDNIDDNAD